MTRTERSDIKNWVKKTPPAIIGIGRVRRGMSDMMATLK